MILVVAGAHPPGQVPPSRRTDLRARCLVQAEVLNLLSRLRAGLGLSYLFVSHDLAVVAHMCSRLAVMKEERIVEEMDVARLRAWPPL